MTGCGGRRRELRPREREGRASVEGSVGGASGKEGSLVFAGTRASTLLKNVIHISATKLHCSFKA